MKVNTINELVNNKNKVLIKTMIFTEKIEFNQELLNIINTFPNLENLNFETDTIFDSSCNNLINHFCNSNIKKIFIKFHCNEDLVWFSKDIKAYNYKNTKIKRCWNNISVWDFSHGNFNYNNLPNEINSIRINSNNKLELTNLPINLLKINIDSQFINPILGCQKWKIPFDCEVYYNEKLIHIDK